MNKQRRNVLNSVLDDLARLRDPVDKDTALKILNHSQRRVEECADEEEMALDARPESFRWSTLNDAMSDNISDLQDAASDLEVLVEQVGNMESFSYEPIKSDITKIVNAIKMTMHR